jgi:hypothetical protein
VARRSPLSRLWSSEHGLTAMLVFLCLAIFVGAPLLATEKIGAFVFDLLFSLLVVSGVVTVARRPLLIAIVSAIALATMVLRWSSYGSPSSTTRVWAVGLSILLLSVLAWLVLVQVFREGPITSQRIQGAIVVYLLIGLAFAQGYEVVYYLVPNAFQMAQPAAAVSRQPYSLLYYSFVTMTTIGYGDILPLHPAARSLAVAEGLAGPLYLAILIARLVSMRMTTRGRDGPAKD